MNPLDPRHLHARNYLPLFDSTRFKTKTKNDKKKKKQEKMLSYIAKRAVIVW